MMKMIRVILTCLLCCVFMAGAWGGFGVSLAAAAPEQKVKHEAHPQDIKPRDSKAEDGKDKDSKDQEKTKDQETGGDDAHQDAIRQDDIKNLIATLEDDTQRAKFLDQLKLLVNEEKKEAADNPLAPLANGIGLRDGVAEAGNRYEDFLNRYNLSSSFVHQMLGSLMTILIGVGLLLGVKSLSYKIIHKLDEQSQRIGLKLSRFNFYTRVLQVVFRIVICGLMVFTLAKIWSITVLDEFFESQPLRNFLGTAFTVLLIAFFAAMIWEGIGLYLSYVLKKADDRNQTRIKTLLPIIRNIVLILFSILFGLVLLSEIGINITPLLAGAGVIGVAVGFGAQSMVKDFLTGFTIILEDIVRVGDVVNIGGMGGLVEQITLRKIQLRDFSGTVCTIPYSQITTIQNLTKDFSFYVMDIGVSYESDIGRVFEVLRGVDEEMRRDEKFAPLMLEPIEIVGVDRFADSAVIIKARLKTLPIQQWTVGREFNRRMKIAFDREGIEIPFPQRMVRVVPSQTPEGEKTGQKAGQKNDLDDAALARFSD